MSEMSLREEMIRAIPMPVLDRMEKASVRRHISWLQEHVRREMKYQGVIVVEDEREEP